MAVSGAESARSEEKPSLTEQQCMTAEKLYILGAKLGNFRVIGPWHNVDAKYLEQQVDRLALPTSRPCSRGHSHGAWAAEDKCFKDFERPKTSYEIYRDQRDLNSGRRSARSGYSLPLMREPRSRSAMTNMSSRASTTNDSTWVGSPYESVTAEELDGITKRVTRPTVSSQGGKTIAAKFENKDYVYGSRTASPDQLHGIVKRVTRSTVASTGGAGIVRRYTDHVIGGRTVTTSELEDVNSRLTRHTVASLGGEPLANKDFNYNPPKITKTNLRVPNLEEKRNRRMKKKVTDEQLNSIVSRLTKLTPAYKAKYSPSPHVWVDDAKRGPAHQHQLAMA